MMTTKTRICKHKQAYADRNPQEMVEILKDYYKKNRDKIKQLLKQYNFDKYVNIDQLNEKALRRLIGIITVRELLEREIDEEDS